MNLSNTLERLRSVSVEVEVNR